MRQFPNGEVGKTTVIVLQLNAYSANHENILQGMLADEDCDILHVAVNKILAIRSASLSTTEEERLERATSKKPIKQSPDRQF